MAIKTYVAVPPHKILTVFSGSPGSHKRPNGALETRPPNNSLKNSISTQRPRLRFILNPLRKTAHPWCHQIGGVVQPTPNYLSPATNYKPLSHNFLRALRATPGPFTQPKPGLHHFLERFHYINDIPPNQLPGLSQYQN